MLLSPVALADSNPRALADYVRARAADVDGIKQVAASGYATALADHPGDAAIAIRAYRAALDTGDMALVTRARLVLEKAGVAPADAALLALADAMRLHDQPSINAAVDRIAGGPFAFLTPVIRAWLLVPGDPKAALAALDTGRGGALDARLANETRALIEIATGRAKDGVAILALSPGSDPGSIDLRISAAQLLAHAGAGDAARALLPLGNPVLAAYRAQLGTGAAPSAAFGVARLFARLADTFSEAHTAQAAIALARAAGEIEPDNDRVLLTLATALLASDAADQALVVLDKIPPASPVMIEARGLRIDALTATGQNAAALAAAETLSAAANATSEDAQRYGDLLLAAHRYADAADAYQRAIDLAGPGADWALYLQRGGALDEAGQWRQAEPLLEKAVALAPDSALALNYLGYARLEHGAPAQPATQLLEKAAALEPESASILDSLAWGYFQQGDVARALGMLERASAAEPANAAISEHLGDAYWASGRRYEARYAWRAAAVTADPEDVARLQGKIGDGLPARQAGH